MYRPRLIALAALACCCAALGLPAPAQEQKDEEKKRPTEPVVAVAPSFAKALEMTPEAYLLTFDHYRRLQEELARLRRFAEGPAAQRPSELVLKGKVEKGLVLLTAQYKFLAAAPGAVIRLGGVPAQAVSVSLDGAIPRFEASEKDGFLLRVDKASDKEQTLTLELVLALRPTEPGDKRAAQAEPDKRGPSGQGFGIDLPRAAITRIEFNLPAGARDVLLGGKPIPGTLTLEGNQLSGPLGAIDRLDLDWKPAQAAATAAVTAADDLVQVRLDRQQTTTTARLKLSVTSGQTKTWNLLVPPKARLSFEPGDKERVVKVEASKEKPGLHTIHLDQPSAEPLTVNVTVVDQKARPGPAGKIAVGPFNVVGAARQEGTVTVSSTVAEWHVEPAPRGDLRREAAKLEQLNADPALAAVFRYGSGGERLTGQPWLDVEVESVSGQLKAKPAYVLSLKQDDRGTSWQLQATITVTPRRAGVGRFEVVLPPGCEFDAGSVVLPERGVRSIDEKKGVVEFRLENPDPAAPATVRFEANYHALPEKATETVLALPRLHGMLEQDGGVRLEAPPGVELLPPENTPGLELVNQSIQQLSYRYPRRAPDAVKAQWRPHRPVIRVDSLVDLTLTAGRGRVRHEMRYQLPRGAASRLTLRVPEAAAGLRVEKGGQLDLDRGVARVSLAPGGEALVLSYEFAAAAGALAVPIAWPDRDCVGETRVRVWSEAGAMPSAPADRHWLEQNLEEVPGRDSLPVLVLRSPGLGRPLTLPVAQEDAASRALIERALVRVTVGDNGEQRFRVSYRLGHLGGRHLDFELPAQRLLELSCTLDGVEVKPELPAADAGRLIRLRLDPRLIKRPSVLELSYALPAAQTTLTATLTPPRPRGEAGYPSRWSVTVPPTWVVLGPEPGPGSPLRWGRRQWLYAPTGGASPAELEAWFSGGESIPDAQAPPSLAAWREGDEPLRLTCVPRQTWLMCCSLLVGVGGLLLTRLLLSGRPRRAALAWVLLGLLGLAAMLLAVLWPALAAQVGYGCEPGLLVLAPIVLLQWLLHERSRRKVIFLASFSKPRPGSSLGRREPRPGEPSTVDAPPRSAGSSQERSK